MGSDQADNRPVEDRLPRQVASGDAATWRSAVTVSSANRQHEERPYSAAAAHEEHLINFFNAKRPVTVIVLGVVFAACGVFYGLSPSDSGARPPQQIIIAVVLVLIGLLFVVQGIGSRRR